MSQARAVRYADSGGRQIAYEVIGGGPIDIVTAFEHGSNLDLIHEHPRLDAFLRGIGGFGRLIHMDPRGVGLSDAVEQIPPLEDWVEDVTAVMAAAGSERAAMLGHGYSAQMFMMFAAMHPDLTSALVTINGYARLRQAPDYPGGLPEGVARTLLTGMRDHWGTGGVLGSFNPGMAEASQEWIARLERGSATPRRAVLRQQIAMEIDVRDVLPTIAVPALVIQSADDGYIRADHGRYLAEHIDGATYHELPGADHSPFASTAAQELVELIGSFLTGTSRPITSDRVLKTVAFTDIVGSTETAAHLGDRRWRSTLETYEEVARREIEGSGGRLVKSTGDGSMATFDGPARARRPAARPSGGPSRWQTCRRSGARSSSRGRTRGGSRTGR
jgi:pimeloyl-ACP methyl ester carboxylesterase